MSSSICSSLPCIFHFGLLIPEWVLCLHRIASLPSVALFPSISLRQAGSYLRKRSEAANISFKNGRNKSLANFVERVLMHKTVSVSSANKSPGPSEFLPQNWESFLTQLSQKALAAAQARDSDMLNYLQPSNVGDICEVLGNWLFCIVMLIARSLSGTLKMVMDESCRTF